MGQERNIADFLDNQGAGLTRFSVLTRRRGQRAFSMPGPLATLLPLLTHDSIDHSMIPAVIAMTKSSASVTVVIGGLNPDANRNPHRLSALRNPADTRNAGSFVYNRETGSKPRSR